MDEQVITGEIVETKEPKQRATRVRELVMSGETVWEYSDGSIRNYHGHPVPGTGIPAGEPYRITTDNHQSILARRRLVGLRAQLRGLAAANGVDPSEIDDELLLQAGSAAEAITKHMAETFLGSNSLRGMSESYNALMSPLVGDKRERDPIGNDEDRTQTLIQDLAEIARAINNK